MITKDVKDLLTILRQSEDLKKQNSKELPTYLIIRPKVKLHNK